MRRCGQICYLCGVQDISELTPAQVFNRKDGTVTNTWGLGSCNMGSCDEMVFMTADDSNTTELEWFNSHCNGARRLP